MTGRKTRPSVRARRFALAGLALGIVALDAMKPLYMDDTAYVYLAEQIARAPLDPSGFEIFWLQWPQPGVEAISPPVLPYWLAAAVRLFPASPALWKLWLLPFAGALVFGTAALAARFAPRLELAATTLVALSPALLPSWNLMLDLPALSLSIASLALFARACERVSLATALGAGALAGLAAQTKYTGFLAPAAIVLYGFVYARPAFSVAAASVAAGLFASWELVEWALYDRSKLLWAIANTFPTTWGPGVMTAGLACALGATHTGVGALALAALGAPGRVVATAMVAVVAAFAAVAIAPVSHAVFGALGTGVLLATGAAAARPLARAGRAGPRPRAGRPDVFLALWLLLELAGYFALSPFAAVRRALGVAVVTTLAAARLASHTCRSPPRRRLVHACVAFSVALALGISALDLREAEVGERSARDAARWIRARDPAARIWFVGHWGFAFYARAAGMRPIVPDRSRLSRGDWFVVPDRIDGQKIDTANAPARTAHVLSYDDPIPLETMFHFYSGVSPLRHRDRPRMKVGIFRVREDFVPLTDMGPRALLRWVRGRLGWQSVIQALPSLVRGVTALEDAGLRAEMAETIGRLGPRGRAAAPALRRALRDPDPGVREAARAALRAIGLETDRRVDS